ncbi:MAG: hypothetical protein M3Y03_05510 [Verrucomicrobiota bacterium]|nr:hypothetical protein [Verrucomicrobiota bacterium]
MKLPAFVERMNRRELILTALMAGTVFLLLNFFFWSTLLGMLSRTRTQLTEREALRKEQTIFLKERDMWAKRDAWLKKNQPTLKSPEEASSLLDQIKQIAGKHSVILENPQIGSGESTPNHQAVFAAVETKSEWKPLVHFLYDVQKPESFVVFESVNLAIDSSDQTVMRGRFKIARWFAPKGAAR